MIATADAADQLRLGLCCQFVTQPIRFRTTTATALIRLPRTEQLRLLAELAAGNAQSLRAALEFCAAHGVGSFRILSTILPLVYDVHHHRCLPDQLTIAEASDAARATWNREPLFHLSSPLSGWGRPRPERHHDYVDPRDFPAAWFGWPLTVEVEAKAKELAVARLQRALRPAPSRGPASIPPSSRRHRTRRRPTR